MGIGSNELKSLNIVTCLWSFDLTLIPKFKSCARWSPSRNVCRKLTSRALWFSEISIACAKPGAVMTLRWRSREQQQQTLAWGFCFRRAGFLRQAKAPTPALYFFNFYRTPLQCKIQRCHDTLAVRTRSTATNPCSQRHKKREIIADK